jgi:hypothetical protein
MLKYSKSPAFPVSLAMNEGHQDGPGTWQHPGISIRDYFAAKALQGILSDVPESMYGLDWKEKIVSTSYEIADAMLAEREKNG